MYGAAAGPTSRHASIRSPSTDRSRAAAASSPSFAEKPWDLAKAAKDGDEAAAARLRSVLGDLIEACRLVGLAAAPIMPTIAPRVLAQLGYAFDYAADGNGGPPILDELTWGARAGESGRVSAPEPLFPRLEVEASV